MSRKNDCVEKILTASEKEMLKLNHPYVGSEHLILALLKNQDIKDIAINYGLTYELFKEEILHTPLLKSIINDAKKNAKENNDGIVTPEHLFISVLDSGDGIGIRILVSMGIDIDSLYNELKRNNGLISTNLNKYGYDLSIISRRSRCRKNCYS